MALTKIVKWRKELYNVDAYRYLSASIFFSFLFLCLSSTVLCRLVKGNTQLRSATTIVIRMDGEKIGYELWNGRKKSRAINARGVTGFFADAFFPALYLSFLLLFDLYTCFFFSLFRIPTLNIYTHPDTWIWWWKQNCVQSQRKRRQSVFHVWLCPIKCAVHFHRAAFLFEKHTAIMNKSIGTS